MAINTKCPLCGDCFVTSASNYGSLCRKCNGTEAREKEEAERWSKLTADEKADELLKRVKALETHNNWDGKIG